jgi:ATP-dependent Clp protease protease subunit
MIAYNTSPYTSTQSITPTPVVTTEEGGREDVYSRLLKDRIILVHGNVTEVMVAKVIPQILFLAHSGSSEPVEIHINSGGGSIMDGFGIYDALMYLKKKTGCEIHTVVFGSACSMGAFFFSIGDVRYIGPNSYVMIHQASGGHQGHVKDLQVRLNLTLALNDRALEIMADKCGKSIDQMKDIREDLWLRGQEAIDWGIADKLTT